MKPVFLLSALVLSPLLAKPFQLERGAFLNGGGQANPEEDLVLPESDPSGTDIVRFNNGDIIHGKFEGLEGGVKWSRPDIDRALNIKLKNLTQVVFDGGRQGNPELLNAHVSLVNGDEIPGEIVSLDAEYLLLKSPIAGELKISRNHIKTLTPNPFDGQLKYAGPFTSDGWVVLDRKISKEVRKREAEEAGEKVEDEEEKKEPQPSWVYAGASLYSSNFAPIVYDAQLPDVGRLRFKAAWKNRLYLSVAFHADFTRPIPREVIKKEPQPLEDALEGEDRKKEEAEEELPPLEYESLFDQVEGKAFQSQEWLPESGGNSGPIVYGSSYLLTVSNNYPTLMRHTFEKDGTPKFVSLRGSRINVNLSSGASAEFDLRFDREKSLIYLYVNGQYACQWNDLDGYAGKGGAIAFAATNSNSQVKISDIFVTSWSGTADSANSMKHDERDIALLTNGTDRFSGDTTAITNGEAAFKGEFSEMKIPLAQLSEIHFKANAQLDPDEIKWSDQLGVLLFNPVGRITLTPKSSTANQLKGHSAILGDITVDLSSAVLLNFADEPDGLSDWITDF